MSPNDSLGQIREHASSRVTTSPPAAVEQDHQYLELLALEWHPHPRLSQFPRMRIHFKNAETDEAGIRLEGVRSISETCAGQ